LSLPATFITRKTKHQAALEALVHAQEAQEIAARKELSKSRLFPALYTPTQLQAAEKTREVVQKRLDQRAETWRKNQLEIQLTEWATYDQVKQDKKAKIKAKQERKRIRRAASLTIPATPNTPSSVKFFHRRNQILKKLGYKTYEEYLKSAFWSAVRRRTLTRDRFICRLCPNKATEVHHTVYDFFTLKGKTLQHLYAICSPCHERVTFESPGVRHNPDKMRELTERKALEKALIPILDTTTESSREASCDDKSSGMVKEVRLSV
jgi:hypothetical protein